MAIRVSSLFSRKTELATALQVRNHIWKDHDYLKLLEQIRTTQSRHRYSLQSDTIQLLWYPFPHIKDPLIRYLAHNALLDLGCAVDQPALALSYLASDAYEQAWPVISFNNEAVVAKLLDGGEIGVSVLSHALRSGKWKPSTVASWTKLFELALDFENAALARELWHLSSTPFTISPALLSRFLTLMGSRQDVATLWEIAASNDLPLTSSVAAGSLNCALNAPLPVVVDALSDLSSVLSPGDARLAGDLLAAHWKETLRLIDRNPLPIGNALLIGMYRKYSSQCVLHTYRMLRQQYQFQPDAFTFQIIANAAYRLGNSKVLSAEVWHEFVGNLGIAPDRKICETILMSQLVGSGARSSLFFLSEMHRRRIFLRKYMQRLIQKRFSEHDDNSFVTLFRGDVGEALRPWATWDRKLAIKESGTYSIQAMRNAQIFIEGRDPDRDAAEVLANMIDFELAPRSD